MANTFKALCDVADWSLTKSTQTVAKESSVTAKKEDDNNRIEDYTPPKKKTDLGLYYNIQIHLPETTNMAVYDAIFQSLKKHIL